MTPRNHLYGSPVIKLMLPVPPSSNNMFENAYRKGRVRSEVYRAWIADAMSRISSDKFRLNIRAMPSPVNIMVRIGKIDLKSDLSNRIKAAEDILVKSGLIENDSVDHVYFIAAERAFGEVKDGWIEITIQRAALPQRRECA